MVQNKTLIISFAVLLVVILAAITPLYLQLNSLRAEVSNLSTNLSSKSEELEKSLKTLRESISAIEKKYAELAANVSALPENLRYPLTITDGLGRSVTIVSKPSRIVSIAPSVTEILFAIGAGDLVVGVDKYSNYPPLVKELIEKGKITVIGGLLDPDFEKIIALKPDVIILSTHSVRHAYRFTELGLTAVALKEDSIADVFESIFLVGRITGKIAGALEVITNMKNKINYAYTSVENYIKAENATRVNVFVTVWLEPIWTSGSNTFMDNIVRLAGGKNVFSDLSGWKVVSPEAVVAKAPNIIIATAGTDAQSMHNSIINMAGWNTIPAVINKRVYVLAESARDVTVRPGPRVADAVLLLAIIFYPEAFGLAAKDIPSIITNPEDLFNRVRTTTQIILAIAR